MTLYAVPNAKKILDKRINTHREQKRKGKKKTYTHTESLLSSHVRSELIKTRKRYVGSGRP